MEALHLAFLGGSVIVILISDEHALSWMLGKSETLPEARMRLLHHLAIAGLAGMIATGVILLYPRADFLLAQPLFQIKLLLVGILVANAVLIGKLMPIASERPFATLCRAEAVPLYVSGLLSTLSWVSAAAIGFYLFW